MLSTISAAFIPTSSPSRLVSTPTSTIRWPKVRCCRRISTGSVPHCASWACRFLACSKAATARTCPNWFLPISKAWRENDFGMTVLEAIQKTADFLAKKGVESARLNAELRLAHQLKLPRMKLYLNFDRVLTAPETDGLRELVRRRAAREPLQHITGSTSFCGLEIAVSRHALVPRPETELLAELG